MLPWKLRKRQNFTCQSKSFISIFFPCQNLANDICSQTAKTAFSHLKFISRSCRWKSCTSDPSTRDLGTKAPAPYLSAGSHTEAHHRHHHRHISFPIHDSARLSVFSKSRSNELTIVNLSFLKALSLHSTHTQVNSLS